MAGWSGARLGEVSMIRNARFRALVLLLLLALVASPAVAAGKAPAKSKAPAVVTWLWQTLDRLVPGFAKGRGGMDPDGSPTPDSTPTEGSTTDGRGSMDPDGHA
jgi:hypothetical protein